MRGTLAVAFLLITLAVATKTVWGQDTTATERPLPDRAARADTTDDDTTWSVGYEGQLRRRRQRTQTGVVRDTVGETQVNGVSIGGMILNETSSSIGRRFYDSFYSRWEPPKDASNFTVRIKEQYSPGLGSLVEVELDDQMLFRASLQPDYEQIRTAARRALARTTQYLKQHHEPREVY